MIYLSIYKFPVKKFIWLRFNFHLKLVITTKKVKFAIEQNAFKVWHTTKPNLCNKPIHKLCWTLRIQLCWTDLLKKVAAVFITNWGKYYKVKRLYYKVVQALSQSRAASRYYKVGKELLENWGVNSLQSGGIATTKRDRYYKVGQYTFVILMKKWRPMLTDRVNAILEWSYIR